MQLELIHTELLVAAKKIMSASKFIDYFVHDMLDYSLLNRDVSNFKKTISKFDVRVALNELFEI